MTVFYFKNNKKVNFNPDKRQAIVGDICKKFTKYYPDLNTPKEEATDILQDLFPSYSSCDKLDKIPSLYEQYKTYTSAIQRACYPNYDAIVDIEGQDFRSNQLAATYKASIVYDWYNIDLLTTLDKCQDDWTIKGEAAAYIYWKEEIIQVEEETAEIVPDEVGFPTLVTNTIKRDVSTFKGVDVKRIDPHNLYFDKTQVDDWEHCPKIYRDFIPVDRILADESLKLTKEEKKELKELVYNSNGRVNNITDTVLNSKTKVFGNTVEVLEFEGDFVDPETLEIYHRVEATVIAGKYLGKFQESRKPKSSIIWAAYMKRPDTGRGQSPLRIPELLNQVQNMCADLTLASWRLQTYPTFLAPKGALPTYVNLEAGRPIEYDVDVFGGQAPQKLDFSNGLRGFEFSDFFQRKMENATGINQYMQGATDSSVRTAAESSYIHSGATMRMNREAHLFSHNFLYHLVRTYALFKKVYDTEDRDVPVGNGIFDTVTKEVREGDYTFIIGGSQSAMEREAETQKLFAMLGLPFLQTLGQTIDPYTSSEILLWILNRANFKATDQIQHLININGQLRQVAQQIGIQPKNFGEFRDDMMNYLTNNAQGIAQGMVNGQIPLPPQQQ